MFMYKVSTRWDYVSDSTFFLTGLTVGQGGLGELVIKDRKENKTFRIDYVQAGAAISKSISPPGVPKTPKIESLIPKVLHDTVIKFITAQSPSAKTGVVIKTFFGDDAEPLSLFTDCQAFDIAQFKGAFGLAGTINVYFFYRSGIPKLGPWTELVFTASASADLPKIQALGGIGRILNVTELKDQKK